MQKSFNTEQTTVNHQPNHQPNIPGSISDTVSPHLPDESWARSLFLEPMAKRASHADQKVSTNRGSSRAAIAELRSEVDAMQTAMMRVHRQIHHLTDQLVQTNIQVQQVAGTHPMNDFHPHQTKTVAPSPYQKAKQPTQPRHRTPEPATKSSTYVVPKRSRANLLDQLTRSIPVSVLLVIFGIALAAAVALASPSVTLWIGLSGLIVPLLRGLFITIAVGSAIAFILELYP